MVRGVSDLADEERGSPQVERWRAYACDIAAAYKDGPRLDLPMPFIPPGFEKLVEHGYGERVEVRREPVDDLRAAAAEQTPFFDTATEDFAVVMPRGGKGLPRGGWQIAHRLWGGG